MQVGALADHLDEFAAAQFEVDVLVLLENGGIVGARVLQRLVDVSVENGSANLCSKRSTMVTLLQGSRRTRLLCRLMASRSSLYSVSFVSRSEACSNLEVCRISSENAFAVSMYPSCARYCTTRSCSRDSSLPLSWSDDESSRLMSASSRSFSCYVRLALALPIARLESAHSKRLTATMPSISNTKGVCPKFTWICSPSFFIPIEGYRFCPRISRNADPVVAVSPGSCHSDDALGLPPTQVNAILCEERSASPVVDATSDHVSEPKLGSISLPRRRLRE